MASTCFPSVAPVGHRTAEGLRERAIRLLTTEISFVPHPDFRTAESLWQECTPALEATGLTGAGPALASLPPHLRRLCESELLSAQEETALFREMNYLKFRANALRSRISPDQPDPLHVSEVEQLLDCARLIRDRIVQANMRLVMSIVKRFVNPQQSFDDLLSDGIYVLLQAVEKFDFDRGFRFSTYAYRSIARFAYRSVMTAHKHHARFPHAPEDWGVEQPAGKSSSAQADQARSNLHELTASLLDRLDRRERLIIRSRYALGVHRRVRTFQDLANRLGISKERVRQLEQRAIGKLRQMAAEFELDGLFGVALA